MKKSTIITIIAFVLGIAVLTVGFILLTDNNISRSLRQPATTDPAITTKPLITTGPREDHPEMDLMNEDVSKYVTLGDYKGLTIETNEIEISDEDLDMQVNILLAFDKEFAPVREGSIGEKVIFSFDFTGYLLKEDGVTKDKTFEGGKGVDQLAYIEGDTFYTLNFDTSGNPQGIGTFIDGFAQGLINKNVGDSFDLPVTFPTDYANTEMAGKKVIFEIKIKYIANTMFTDAWVKEYTSDAQKTCDEFEEYLRENINKSLKQSNVSLLWKKIFDNTVVEIPQQQFEYLYYYYRYKVEDYAVQMQIPYDDFVKNGGVTYLYTYGLVDINYTSDEELVKLVNDMITNDLVMLAIIQAENMQATDEEYNLFLDTLVTQTGKTKEEILEIYGEDFIRTQIVFYELDNKLYDLNNFVLKTEE